MIAACFKAKFKSPNNYETQCVTILLRCCPEVSFNNEFLFMYRMRNFSRIYLKIHPCDTV